MPLSPHYLKQLEGRPMSRTDIVSFELVTEVYGALIHLQGYVRPLWDQHLPGNVGGITADVYIEGHDKEYPCSSEDGETILRRIKAEQESVWSEIEAQADRNHKERAA